MNAVVDREMDVANRTYAAEEHRRFPRTVTGFRSLILVHRNTTAAIVLAIIAALMWLFARDFPLGVHPDELIKVQTVLRGLGTYYHPLLMIELTRVANCFLGLRDPQSVVELGRAFSATAGGVLIFATFVLARMILPASTALAASAAILATPLISVHARYFKEDIFLAAFVILALAALIFMLRTPTVKRAIMLGAAIGLAAGSKYVGVILLPYASAVIIAFGNSERISARVLHASIVALTVITVLAGIQMPAFMASNQFFSDLRLETIHATIGHRISCYRLR